MEICTKRTIGKTEKHRTPRRIWARLWCTQHSTTTTLTLWHNDGKESYGNIRAKITITTTTTIMTMTSTITRTRTPITIPLITRATTTTATSWVFYDCMRELSIIAQLIESNVISPTWQQTLLSQSAPRGEFECCCE